MALACAEHTTPDRPQGLAVPDGGGVEYFDPRGLRLVDARDGGPLREWAWVPLGAIDDTEVGVLADGWGRLLAEGPVHGGQQERDQI